MKSLESSFSENTTLRCGGTPIKYFDLVSSRDSLHAKVRAILEKANHPTTPQAEAETALALAFRLMQKYDLDEDLLETLREAKFDFVEGDDSRICVNYEGQLIVLDLLDGRWPIVRCTIELVTGVERTLDLLKEIDMQNEGRVNTKYFMRGDTVIACVDVRCDGLEHFKQELLSLVADYDLLGSYLASLGIVGDELTLI